MGIRQSRHLSRLENMRDPETPLVFTFLNEQGAPLLFVLLVISATMAAIAPLLAGLIGGPMVVWLIVRVVNRRDDPLCRRVNDDEPDESGKHPETPPEPL